MQEMRIMEPEMKTGMVLALLLGIVVLAGCTTGPGTSTEDYGKVQRFSSYEEMVASFEDAQKSGYGFGVNEVLAASGVQRAAEDASTGTPAPSGGTSENGTPDFSTTNVQVEGVDEADIVKSDGKYIYNVVQNKLIITDAYPIEDAQILVQYDLGDLYAQELLVQGDKLLVFGWISNYYENSGDERSIYPYYGGSGTAVRLYDISDRSSPQLVKELEFEGSYLTSRLIGSHAYFVINSYPRYYVMPFAATDASGASNAQEEGEESIIPTYKEDGVEQPVAVVTDIAYIPPMPTESFVTLASLNLDNGELEKETIAGTADTAFASADNIYLSASTWVTPDIPGLQELIDRISDLTNGTASVYVPPEQKTIVNKFHVDNGSVEYVAQGRVPGHVLNQFSMDEYGGNFRIAVTVEPTFSGIRPLTMDDEMRSRSVNNLYVMNEDMEVIGSLEDLAPGESIYSARFIGERAYLVTFQKVDPLFVIDTSDPTNPIVLGKLKIPGFSDYLHPIDEDHIIGVGKEAVASSSGDFAWYQGMKLAVFDVSDVNNPIEQNHIVIGDRGTDSYALRDHKAFLYDKEKELLVLPVLLAEIPEEQKEDERYGFDFPAYGEPVFQGAFVYRLTLENGFEELGRITHITDEEELKRGYYYSDVYSVKRAMYIDDVLYTLSDQQLQANALDTLEELKVFKFDLPEPQGPYYDGLIEPAMGSAESGQGVDAAGDAGTPAADGE